MSLKKILNFRNTLSFRLTLWYALTFFLISFLALFIFYHRISYITMKNTDKHLLEEVNELAVIMSRQGFEEVITEFDEEIIAEGENKFFRLLSSDGTVLRSGNVEKFGDGNIDVSDNALQFILKNENQCAFETLEIPDYDHKIRVIYGAISPTKIYNMGQSLEENEAYLTTFSDLILLLIMPFFCLAAWIGWFLARHALKGVEEVTQTAIEISQGTLDNRVQAGRRHDEIDKLASTFNHMLDRIQTLIKEMQEMTDNVAHELRSPLTRMRGIAEITLMGNGSVDDYAEMAASTIEECDNLIELINTMLDITETEAGVNRLEPEPLDIGELILSACQLFDPIAQEKEIQLMTDIPEKIIIAGDRKKLQRLFSNLLENAIKYNKVGGTVTISVKKENQAVVIKISDTGIGIRKEDLPHIFDRFYRCDRSRSLAGAGLGLSLAKAIVKSFNGEIRVESEPDKGSTFWVNFKDRRDVHQHSFMKK